MNQLFQYQQVKNGDKVGTYWSKTIDLVVAINTVLLLLEL